MEQEIQIPSRRERLNAIVQTCSEAVCSAESLIRGGAGHYFVWKPRRFTPVPRNLANGLYDVVVDSQAPASFQHSLIRKPTKGDRALEYAIKDKQGRFVVDIHLDGTRSIAAVRQLVRARQDCRVTAVEHSFQAGTIEAFVTPVAAATLATQPGIASISLVWKPRALVGAVTTQGVVQHRVNKIASKYDGTGIKIGVLSDSYDSFISNGVLTGCGCRYRDRRSPWDW